MLCDYGTGMFIECLVPPRDEARHSQHEAVFHHLLGRTVVFCHAKFECLSVAQGQRLLGQMR